MAKKKKGGEEDGAAPDAEKEKGGGKKGGLVPIIVLALAILGGGAMAGGLVGGGGGAATAEAAEQVEPEPEPTELGMLVELEALTLNLADGRFLKVSVALEMGAEVVEEPPTAPIYDAIIATFNTLTVETLSDPAQRNATKTTLLEALTPMYGEDIVGVYYTEFVMQ